MQTVGGKKQQKKNNNNNNNKTTNSYVPQEEIGFFRSVFAQHWAWVGGLNLANAKFSEYIIIV